MKIYSVRNSNTFNFCFKSLSEVFLPILLANINSRSRSLYAVARPSVVCLSSVTLVRPTQRVEIFRNVSSPFGIPWPH